MNTTTKNNLYILLVIIIVGVLAYIIYQGSESGTSSSGGTSTSAVTTTNGDSTGVNAASGTAGTGSIAGAVSITDDATLTGLIGSALVRVPSTGVDVALTQGGADFIDGSTHGHVQIEKIIGKVATNDGFDIFASMSVTKTGSVIDDQYVALFSVMPNKTTKYTSAVLVGDRLTVQNVQVAQDTSAQMKAPQQYMDSTVGYLVTINYLDRNAGEPLTTTPSVAKTLSARVKGHVLTD